MGTLEDFQAFGQKHNNNSPCPRTADKKHDAAVYAETSLQRTQINTKEGGRSEVFGRSHGGLLVLSLDHLVMLAALQIISQLRVVGVGGALPGSLPLKETSRALRKPTGSTVSSVTSTVTFQ